jgi:hypothetical protein
MPAIPALQSLRQENLNFKDSLNSIMRPFLKTLDKKKKRNRKLK